MVMSIDELKGSKSEVQQSLNRVFEFISLPPSDLEDLGAKNTREYVPMDPEIKRKLEEFYEPYNERLFALLGKRMTW